MLPALSFPHFPNLPIFSFSYSHIPTLHSFHSSTFSSPQSPIPSPQSPIATRLKQLDALKSQGLITESEYADKRGKILAEL